MVYPEGNWIDATPDSPYFIIGRTSYGKPILDRLLTYDTPLAQAVALAYLAFDSTRASVVDVEFPIDLVLLVAADGVLHEHRFTVRRPGQRPRLLARTPAVVAGRVPDGLGDADVARPAGQRRRDDELPPDEEAVVEAGGEVTDVDAAGDVEIEGPNSA